MNRREQFEAWWAYTMNTDLWDLYRFGDGYACHETNRAWMAWQASREALEAENAELVAALEDALEETFYCDPGYKIATIIQAALAKHRGDAK